MNRLFLHLLTLTLLWVGAHVMAQPVPFNDTLHHLWGYKDEKGVPVIPPRYSGAGQFIKGRAAVEDDNGFAVINEQGAVIERIATDAVQQAPHPLPPPDRSCAWSGTARFPAVPPSTGLDCYINKLRGTGPTFKAEIIRQTEGRSQVTVYRFSNGVALIHDQGYEGSTKRLLLPGVSPKQANEWQQMLYPDAPIPDGCAEYWMSGAIKGGSYIEQAEGC